jgi:hypothetical protein
VVGGALFLAAEGLIGLTRRFAATLSVRPVLGLEIRARHAVLPSWIDPTPAFTNHVTAEDRELIDSDGRCDSRPPRCECNYVRSE